MYCQRNTQQSSNGEKSEEASDILNNGKKKGDLIFDASFESGNLERVDYVSECEYDLFIRPDTKSPRHRVWFYFSVKNVRAEQPLIFNVVNFSKNRSLYRDGMAPVVKSISRPQWQRIPSRHVRFDKSSAHKDQYVISFGFEFDREDDVYYFAYSYPYTYTKLQQHLSSIEDKSLAHFQREVLVTSEQGRRLDLITITDPINLAATNDSVRRIIFITARVHPGEPPASFLCQGIIDFLTSDNPIAVILRRTFVFKIVPMLNPDGVFLGNGRCSASGVDLNRVWDNPSEAHQPTIYATKKLLIEYNRDPRFRVEFFIDLHSHSQLLNAFMYGNVFSNDQDRCERQAILPTLMSEIADDFCLDSTLFNTDPQKSGTGRRVVATALNGKSMCYTFEVSIFGYMRAELIVPYTEESYQELGRKLAYSFYEYVDIERGARSIETRPFRSFLGSPVMAAILDRSAPVSKRNSLPPIVGKKIVSESAGENVSTRVLMKKLAANYPVTRMESSPTITPTKTADVGENEVS